MPITSAQKNDILGVVVGLFNASPGNEFLRNFTTLIEGGTTVAQLANTIAATPAFTSGIMGGKTTTAAQVTEMMSHYGLVADGVAGSPASQAEAFFTSSITAGVGFGAIAVQATDFLLGPAVPAAFTQTANLFKNKIAVADVHSATIFSQDLATLQAPMFNLDGTKVLTPAEATNYLVTEGILFNVSASSVALSSPLPAPVGAIGVPDAFTVNIGSAGGALDIGAGFSVTPLDAAGTFAGGNAESFTLNAIGDVNAREIIANGIESLIISSATELDVRFIAPDADVITIIGNGNVDLETNASTMDEMTIGKVSAINAGGSTGNIAINFAAHTQSVTYTGSAGTDVYVGSSQGDIITGGKGGDFFILEAAKAAQDVLVVNAGDAQIRDTDGDGRITILVESDFEMIDNFTVGAAATADRFDVSGLAFTGAQRGIVDVAAKVPTFDTDLTNIPDLFLDTAGDRGVAFSEIALPPELGVSQTVMFIDANKDGNLTAADDIVIEVMGAGALVVENFIF
jgi:hypothetical protein